MDYLQFKKRIILTRSYNFIFFENATSITNELSVSIINISGLPIVCVIGNSVSLNSLVELLNSNNMECNIADAIAVSTDAILKNSISAKETLSEQVNVGVTSNILAGQFAKVNMEELVSILINVYAPPPIRPMEINIDITISVDATSRTGLINLLAINFVNTVSLENAMAIGAPMDINSTIVSEDLSMTIVMAKDTPIIIAGSINSELRLLTIITTAASNLIPALPLISNEIVANVGLVRYSKLSDYTNVNLSAMNQTLNQLSYFDIL